MSYNTIIQKSIEELRTQKSSYEKEVFRLDSAICTLEDLISKDNIIESVKKEVRKPQRKTRGNGYANRGKITEDSVRDAIIELIKNPPPTLARAHRLESGCITSSQIAKVLEVSESRKIRDILIKFENKGMLESRAYKRGKQYKYVHPYNALTKDINFLISPVVQREIAQSVPIPGTGKNNAVIRNKDVEKMVAQAKSEGFTVERLGSDHLRISKNGTGKMATISATGRDKARYVENVKSDLRRIGVNI